MRRALPACLVLAALAAAPGASPQSLGETARKEKERRGAASKPTPPKVYGEDDLQRYAKPEVEADQDSSPAPDAPKTPDAANPPKAPAARTEPPSAEGRSGMDALRAKTERWRSRHRTLKGQIEDLERLIAELHAQGYEVLSERAANELLASECRPGGEPGRCAGRRRCAEAVIGLETLKKKLADLVEEARRAGVPSAQLES